MGSHLSSITYLLPGASAFSLYIPEQECVCDGLDFLGRLRASLLQGLPELTPLHLPLKELCKEPVSVSFSTFSGSMSPRFSLPLQVEHLAVQDEVEIIQGQLQGILLTLVATSSHRLERGLWGIHSWLPSLAFSAPCNLGLG